MRWPNVRPIGNDDAAFAAAQAGRFLGQPPLHFQFFARCGTEFGAEFQPFPVDPGERVAETGCQAGPHVIEYFLDELGADHERLLKPDQLSMIQGMASDRPRVRPPHMRPKARRATPAPVASPASMTRTAAPHAISFDTTSAVTATFRP